MMTVMEDVLILIVTLMETDPEYHLRTSPRAIKKDLKVLGWQH